MSGQGGNKPAALSPSSHGASPTGHPLREASRSDAPRVEVDELYRLLGRLADSASGAGTWPAADRQAVLAGLDRAIDGLTGVRARVLVAEKAAGTWQARGDRSFEAWRGRASRTGPRAARNEVRQAETLHDLPKVGDALAQGRISAQHVATITRLGGGTPAQQEAVRSTAGQDHLLRLAQRHDAETFATAAARWVATHDPAGLERGHHVQRANRFLHVVDTHRGTVIKGQLDSIAGHRLRLALEAATPHPAADDDRDFGQRAADALDAIATRILTDKTTTPGAHVPPQVSLLLTEETWAGARRALRHQRAAARGGSHCPEQVAHPPATLEDGTPVPDSELAAALCDCEITRIVVGSDGLPTDLGRATRLFTGAMRKAIIARDRHCSWPDCHALARWCHIHHIDWWERDDGPTSLDNGVLLCSYHHHEVHRRDLAIRRVVGTSDPTRPAPTRPGTPAGELATVRYEFQERSTGRAVGAPGIRARSRPTGTGPPSRRDPDRPEALDRSRPGSNDARPGPDGPPRALNRPRSGLTGARSGRRPASEPQPGDDPPPHHAIGPAGFTSLSNDEAPVPSKTLPDDARLPVVR